jgi:hypothetical protein
MTFANETKYIG